MRKLSEHRGSEEACCIVTVGSLKGSFGCDMDIEVYSISGPGAPSSEEPGFCPNNNPLLSAGDRSRDGVGIQKDQVALKDHVEGRFYLVLQQY